MTYEPTFNQVTSILDPKGNATTLSYDANGNPITITDALNNTTTLAYDSRGLLTRVTDALGNITSFAYDARGNLTSTTDPLGNNTTLSFDEAGNVVSSTDALGRTTAFTYDAMNRLTQVTDAAGGITRYGYDGNGNLLTVTDAKGQQTTFAYDGGNQLSQTTNPLGQAKTFAYDLARNLVSSTDAKNQNITFAYDALNRLVQKALPGGELVSFAYDVNGNLALAQDADSQLAFTYDGFDRLTSVTTGGSGLPQPQTTLRIGTAAIGAYDANGNRTQMTDPQGGMTTYAYDALNRLTSLTSPQGTTNFNYDALSRRTSMTLPNGVVTNYTYDAASQLTSLVHQLSGSAIAGFSYSYDKVGNRTAMAEVAGTNSYSYDQLNRLIQATHPQPVNPTESFTYDPVGNRTSSHLAAGQVHDGANRLLEDSNFTNTYDENGNLTTKTNRASGEITTYTYDAEDRLIRAEKAGLVAAYRYDALGSRIEKNVNGVLTRYVYDNEDVILELDGSNQVIARYTHGPSVDEPLVMFRNGQSVYYHADGLTSISALTDLNGTPVRSYTYDAFGRMVAQVGTVTNPYTYTVREFDPETGLYHYRFRYLDPGLGTFLQEDPIGTFENSNLYSYSQSNPVNFVDPFGLRRAVVDFSGAVKSNQAIREALPDFIPKVLLDILFPTTPEGVAEQFIDAAFGLGFCPLPVEGGARLLPFEDLGLTSRLNQLLDDIKSGVTRFRKDGTIFKNREGLLPGKPRGYYREFTVPTPAVADRGTQRVVVGRGGETYFTPNHYRTFIQIQGP